MNKKTIRTFMLMLSLLGLVACSDSSNSNNADAKKDVSNSLEKEDFSIGSSAEGGLYHTNATTLAQTITEKAENVDAKAEPTGGSVENVRLLSSGETDLGIVSADTMYDALNGEGEFEDDIYEDFSIIASGHTSYAQVSVPEDSEIESISDLEGKTVAWRLQGSSTVENMGKAIFAEYGLNPDEDFKSEIASPYEDAAQRMNGARTDAIITFPGVPTPWVVEYLTGDSMKLIGVDEEKIDNILDKYPFYEKGIIKADTYDKIDYDVPTVAFKAMLVANDELSEDTVYEITKSLLENEDYATSISSGVEPYVDKDNVTSVEGVGEYHPGAIKYYKEIGIWDE